MNAFEKNFPSLKDKVQAQEGINYNFIDVEDIVKHCKDNQKIVNVLNEIEMKQQLLFFNDKARFNWKKRVLQRLQLAEQNNIL